MGVMFWLRPIAAALIAIIGAVSFVLFVHEGLWLLALLGLVGFGAGVKLVTLEEEQAAPSDERAEDRLHDPQRSNS